MACATRPPAPTAHGRTRCRVLETACSYLELRFESRFDRSLLPIARSLRSRWALSCADRPQVCVRPDPNSTHCDDLRALSGGASWYTTWDEADRVWASVAGCGGREPSVAGLEYVPQVWSAHRIEPPALNTSRLGRAKYLLGFNEPDKQKLDPAVAAAVRALALAHRPSGLDWVHLDLTAHSTFDRQLRRLVF